MSYDLRTCTGDLPTVPGPVSYIRDPLAEELTQSSCVYQKQIRGQRTLGIDQEHTYQYV